MILELKNIFQKPDKNGEIVLNEEQIQMFEKTLQKYEKYKDKKVIILKKRANGFMYIYK
jgi:hypothetical protein